MSDYLITAKTLSALPAGLVAHRRILGGWLDDLPDSPLRPTDLDFPLPGRTAPAFTEAQTNRHRRDALWLLRAGRRFLGPSERFFVDELVRWRAPLSIWEADRLAQITDRVDDQRRGRL